ncbi:MAG: hypothetical protein MZV64_27180 [Ignavibacteriales bacterium]|nr:hypothetical protein [Ignavibacteriales bacterium]
MLAKTSIGVGNYIGGSPFNLLINGYFLGLSYKEAQHAKEGEKMSSFMEDMLGNWIGGYLMMSPIAKVLNGVSELKHYKMGAESVGKVQTLSSRC